MDGTAATFDVAGRSAVREGADGEKANGYSVLTSFTDLDALERAVGGATLQSRAITITQNMIDEFASTTQDEQWIHVDRERARRESPYGTTIAHGFLTLSLLTPLLKNCAAFPFARAFVNYGFDRVRFTAPVPANGTVFGRFALATATRTPDGARLAWNVEIVLANGKAAVAATWLMLVVNAVHGGYSVADSLDREDDLGR